jgi:hypothetical protein
MLSSFICGSFKNQLEVEEESWNSPSSTPERSSPSATPERSSPSATPRKSRKSSKTGKNSKNPYSSRGLDKFSALLAELEEKKQKIYSQMGPEDVPMVRFVYSSSNDCIPLIIKVKDQKQDKPRIGSANDIKENPNTRNNEGLDKLPIEAPVEEKQVEQPRLETAKKTENKSFTWNMKLHRWRRPYYYMPVALILILLLVVLFGRSVAILLTSLAWYIVPALSTKKPSQKKDYVRRLSEPAKMMINHGVSSPARKSTGSTADKWPRRHGQRKSF